MCRCKVSQGFQLHSYSVGVHLTLHRFLYRFPSHNEKTPSSPQCQQSFHRFFQQHCYLNSHWTFCVLSCGQLLDVALNSLKLQFAGTDRWLQVATEVSIWINWELSWLGRSLIRNCFWLMGFVRTSADYNRGQVSNQSSLELAFRLGFPLEHRLHPSLIVGLCWREYSCACLLGKFNSVPSSLTWDADVTHLTWCIQR